MENLAELTVQARNRRRELDSLMGEARVTLARGKDLEKEIVELTESIQVQERATLLLNSIGEERQLKAQQIIEELVTRGLQTIFDDSLSFHILQTVRGKTANVEFVVRETRADGFHETPVMEARGGGLAATIGFLLRIVVMLLKSKNTTDENILILDETFAHVSDEYLPALGDFLREIVDKTGTQIVMVTHQSEFVDYADRVYRFTKKDGKTQVSEDA